MPEVNATAGTKRSIGARLASGGGWVLSGRLVAAIGGMLVSALLARMLAPEELGSFFIISSIAITGAMLAQFGTHQAVVRLIAGGLARNELSEVHRSIRAIFLIAGAGGITIAGGYALGLGGLVGRYVFNSATVQATTLLTATLLILRHNLLLLEQTFRGFHDLRLVSLTGRMLPQVLLVVILAAAGLTMRNFSLQSALQATIASTGISVAVSYVLLWKKYWANLPPVKGASTGEAIKLSWPLFVSSTSIIVLGEMHLWLLGAVAVPNQVAIYGAGFRLMQLILIPLVLVNQVIPPTIAELYTQGQKQKLERVLRSTAALAIVPALMVFILLMVFSGTVLQVIFGEYYRAGAPVLIIMSIGQLLNMATGSPGVLLAMSDHQRLLMYASLSGGLCGILISALLVWKFAAIGVAAGYAFGLTVQNIIMAVLCWRAHGIKTYAGLAAMRDLLFWFRSAVARRAHRITFFLKLERMLWPLENTICALSGVQIVECFGDSHVNVFSRINRSGCFPGVYLRTIVVRGATAFGLANPNSKTGAYNYFSKWSKRVPAGHWLLFLLGEVDVGYLVWKKSEKDGSAPKVVMEEAIRRYLAFLDAQKSIFDKMIVVTVPLPAVDDDGANDDMETLRPGIKASLRERTALTLAYNQRLRVWATENDIYLVDLDSELLDPSTGLLKNKYRKQHRVDNHLDPDAFSALLCRLLSQLDVNQRHKN